MAAQNLALKFSGENVNIGGVEYVAAPLPIGKMKLLSEAFADGVSESELFENMIFFIHASIARNHPEVTTEMIEDELTIMEASDLFQRVIKMSGIDTSAEKKRTQSR